MKTLYEELKTKVCAVTFTKKDGSIRILVGTQNMSLIPNEFHPKKVESEDEVKKEKLTTAIFDVDLQMWRSFTNSSVIEWAVV